MKRIANADELNEAGWAKIKTALPKEALERLAVEFGIRLDCHVPIMVCNDLVAAVVEEFGKVGVPFPACSATRNSAT
jgi:hypothetical protein